MLSERSSARKRRGALYGPPPRLTSTSPLVGRLVWHIGDWGRASEHIGSRWEVVAARLLGERLEASQRLLVPRHRADLMSEVLGTGLPHADALRGWAEGGALHLEPLDFKWSLQTASARQVSTDTLAALLDLDTPHLRKALQSTRESLRLPAEAPVELHDGRFVAPEHPENRLALRNDPDLPNWTLPLEAHPFFEPLPGWPAAKLLARLEGADLARVRGVEGVERLYRLGAGVAGALSRLGSGLFDEAPGLVDVPGELDLLRRTGRAPTLHGLLLHLEARLAARRAQEETLANLPRAAYAWGRLRTDLTKAGVPRGVTESRGALGRVYAEIMKRIAAEIRAAGRELVHDGASTDDALARLGEQADRWASLGAARAAELAEDLAKMNITTPT